MTSKSAPTIAPFRASHELVNHAKGLIQARCDSLEKDVAHCLTQPYAPFPAILYCFSTIDLFGALAAGRADSNRRATEHTKKYMTRFMHKLVHLATPKPVFSYEGNTHRKRQVVWNYTHNVPQQHLKLEEVVGVANIDSGLWMIPYDQSFWSDIPSFTTDIISSAVGYNGYLTQLKSDRAMQVRYAATVNDLYDPTK